MSRKPDMHALALQLGQQSMAPLGGAPELLERRVVWTRERQGLFGTWTKETLSLEVRELHWLDRHENTNSSLYGDETTRWLR